MLTIITIVLTIKIFNNVVHCYNIHVVQLTIFRQQVSTKSQDILKNRIEW